LSTNFTTSCETKPRLEGHKISWSYKYLPTKLGHLLTKIGSREVLEVAVKSFGTFAGNAKVVMNEANFAMDVVVIKPLNVLLVSSKNVFV